MLIGRIKNFLKIKEAEIDIHQFTGIFGKNGACGEVLPIDNVLKKDARDFVNDKAKKSEVTLIGKEGQSMISWPSCKIKTTDIPVVSSAYAVGLMPYNTINKKDLPNILSEYMSVMPTEDALKKALSKIKMSPESIDRVWEQLEVLGWDTVTKNVEQKGKGLKGQWKEVTRESYGSAKAVNWIPENYSSEMEAQSEEYFQAKYTEANEFLESALASEAVSNSDQNALKLKAEEIPVYEKKLQEIKSKGKEVKAAIAGLIAERDKLPQPTTTANAVCPHCNKGVILSGSHAHYNIVAPEYISDEENKARQDSIDELNNEISTLAQNREALKSNFNNTKYLYDEAKKALETLNNISDDKSSEADINKARTALTTAKEDLESFQRKQRADKLQKQITINKSTLDIIGPEGLRKESLGDAIESLNNMFAEIIPEWNITVDSDLCIEKDQFPFHLLSKSHQMQCIIMFQLALAKLDNSDLIIVDEVDIFDNEQKSLLLKALKKFKAHVIICATVNKKEKAPNFSKSGIGKSYWVEDGEVSDIK